MSDTQAKATPSKAAMDLAENFAKEIYGPYMATVNAEHREMAIAPIAQMIQSALSDLLTQAQYVVDADPNDVTACQHFLAAALEPWQPK